jgi:hypothetical protein
MKTIRTIELDGLTYAVPAGMTENQLASFCGQLLLLQRVDYCCDKEYKRYFNYLEGECVRVRIGTRETYGSQASARTARDAYNATLPEKESA